MPTGCPQKNVARRNVGVNIHLLIAQFHLIKRSLRHPLSVALDSFIIDNELCLVCKWVSNLQWIDLFANERWLVCKWVKTHLQMNPHLQMSQDSFANESILICKWVTSHLQMSSWLNCTHLQFRSLLICKWVLICKWNVIHV